MHDTHCHIRQEPHSDAARRIADTYNLHRIADPIGNLNKWFACRLADGTTDGILYDNKHDAVFHQHHNELQYVFIPLKPTTMSYCDAETFLRTMRQLSDRGIRLTDRDCRTGGPDMIPRVTREDQRSQVRSILYGTKPSNLLIPEGN